MTSNHIGPGHGDLDDNPSLVAGSRPLRLTSWQKVGIAALLAFVFLTFIWVDHALQAQAIDKAGGATLGANATAFRPAPLLPLQEASQPSVPTRTAGEMSPEESPLFAYSNNPTGPQASPILAGSPGQASGQIVPALAASLNDSSNAISTRLKPTVTQLSKAVLLPHPVC